MVKRWGFDTAADHTSIMSPEIKCSDVFVLASDYDDMAMKVGFRDLRIEQLEAALREVATGFSPDGSYVGRPIYDIAPFTAETAVERPEHATAQLVTQAQTPRSDINIPCSCGPGDCNKRILAHNEYCTEDRRAFEVEEDLLLDRRVYGTSFHKIVDGKKVRVHPQDVRYINGEPRDSSNTACTAQKTTVKHD